MRQGWVYVMVNASMRNMVKVGRTTREPRLRVAELSSATGVPTPFVLEFGQIYADCERAEREIHEALDERGLRVSANREFFRGPARNIVRIIMAHAGQEQLPARGGRPARGDDGREQPTPPVLRDLARLERLDAGARAGDHFCYAEIATLAATESDAAECLRSWDLFFEAHAAACAALGPDVAGEGGTGMQADPRMIPACRRYITCCLMLGRTPGHMAILLQAADDMLDQQVADLRRLRGTAAAPRIAAVMRWIYDHLASGQPGDAGVADTDAPATDGAGQGRTAAA